MPDVFYRRRFCLGPDHPCLPGHFPGEPVFPGVLVLELLATALRESLARPLRRVSQVKYLQPWRPGREVELQLQEAGSRVAFEVWDGDRMLARGLAEAGL